MPLDRLTDPDVVMAFEPTLSTLASEVEASSSSAHKFDDSLFSETSGLSSISGRTKEQMRKYYIRSLHKVVDQSDIILLVLTRETQKVVEADLWKRKLEDESRKGKNWYLC